ncbi:MAG: ABC transporter substrate-binding protein [Roseovarius sp.]|nr:ABC transporter substrate-binding protein [Roseovarius sp.]MCY4209368.1 ABC transporter substrate-binding protein [Roseovarius sp.]
MSYTFSLVFSAVFSLMAAFANAETPGVYKNRILFGQSAAFSGPAKNLGSDMKLGIEAAFSEVNEKGGVHGRVLKLLSVDDYYEPDAAIVNTRQLIEDDKVFALIGAVGTPTSRSSTPIARAANVPYLAPFTGAAFLRDPDLANVINLRASYYQETEEMVERLITDLGIDRIAAIYQNDSFGWAGFSGVKRALSKRGLSPAATGVYPRNTTAVKTALIEIQQGLPEAVIIIGAYEPVAETIIWAKKMGMDAIFFTISFVGGDALVQKLGPSGIGVYVTQVVPFPKSTEHRVAAAYRDALESFAPSAAPGFVSFEGYLAGRLAIHALELCGEDPKRSCLIDDLKKSGQIDIDGFVLQYDMNDNQGSDEVYLTVIGDGGIHQPIKSLRDEAIK